MLSKRNPRIAKPRHGLLAFALILLLAFAFAACSDGQPNPLPTPGDEPPATTSSPASPTPSPTPATPIPPVTDASLDDAHRMVREGRYEEAAAAFDGIVLGAGEPGLKAEALLGGAIARFETGDRQGSIARLRDAIRLAPRESATARRAAYLLARRLGEDGHHRAAADLLRGFVEPGMADALQPYLDAEYARALGAAGDRDAARARWDALLARPGLPFQVERTAYRDLATLADDDDATPARLAWLHRLAALTRDPADRYELATVARDAGDLDTFAAQLRALVAAQPASRWAPIAIADLDDAGFSIDPGLEGLVYYRRGAFVEAQRVLAAAVEDPAATPVDLAFRSFYLGAAYEDGGLLAEAVAAYDQAVAFAPASDWAHRARYWAARVSEYLGDPAAASQRYLALVLEGPLGEFTEEAAFRAGYTLLAAGDPTGAIATWDRLALAASPRLYYWKGRAHDELGDAAAAEAAFIAAAESGPLDFYGLEAARRLGRAEPVDVSFRPLETDGSTDWDALAAWVAATFGGTPPAAEPTAAGELVALGLVHEAEEAIRIAAEGADPWRLLALMREAHGLGLPDVVAQFAIRLRQDAGIESHEAPRELLRLAYPLAYIEQLERAARENNLDPLFLAALVRQESFWDATAGSHAGALGLTQVIPPTGEAIASALGRDFRPDDLFRPAVALEFGAYYLGGQLGRLGDPYHALAAYNAGPGPLPRWTANGAGGPADFVEAVEYQETKHYVVYVMEHYAHYVRAWR